MTITAIRAAIAAGILLAHLMGTRQAVKAPEPVYQEPAQIYQYDEYDEPAWPGEDGGDIDMGAMR